MNRLESHFNWFLGFLVVSLIGNACADFAVLWHCVSLVGGGSEGISSAGSHWVTAFYSGQAAGAICLAPVLSAWVDRRGKRFSSIALDVTYAGVLILMLLASRANVLSASLLFPFGAVTAALGALHRGAIGYGAVKVLSDHLQLTKLVAKFNAAIYMTNLIGSLISGLLFRFIGLDGCLMLAIVTFLPMPLIYLRLFAPEKPAGATAPERHLLMEVKTGLSFIARDPKLWVNSLVVAIWNMASNIFPGIVGIAFQKAYPGRTDLASIAVSLSILGGILAFSPMEKIARDLPLNRIMIYALSPAMLALALCALSGSPILMAGAFALHCMGAALVNITSGSLRISSVPQNLIGRVNTAHSALVSLGQVVGSVVLIPVLATSVASGAGLIFLAYGCSSLLAATLFPGVSLSTAIGRAS